MARHGHGEDSIYQRSDGRWAASISLKGGKRKTFYGKTRKEAPEQLETALYDQQKGMLATGPQQTVEQFCRQWLEAHQATIRIRPYKRYEELMRLHIIPALGRHQLQKLTAQQIQAFYTKKLNDGLSPTTVNGLHVSMEQSQQWLAAAKGHSLEALFVPALTTGMRRGEILALKCGTIRSTLDNRR